MHGRGPTAGRAGRSATRPRMSTRSPTNPGWSPAATSSMARSSRAATAASRGSRRRLRSHPTLCAPPCGTFDLASRVAGGQRLPLVVGPLAARQGDLDLRLAVLEVQRQRHKREPTLLRLADQLRDLLAVQQELARPPRLVVGPRPLVVLRDVRVLQPHLAVLDVRIGIDERRTASAQRLHLGAGQYQARLDDILEV